MDETIESPPHQIGVGLSLDFDLPHARLQAWVCVL